MRRRFALALTGLLAATLAAGCIPAAHVDDNTPTARPSVGESLRWRDCSAKAKTYSQDIDTSKYTIQCGTVAVPQNWKTAKDGQDPDGKTFSIALIRLHLKAQTARIGSILTNPGGPGGSGVEFAVQFAPQATPLLMRFDLIGFDPRGVGLSDPVRCFSGSDLDAMFGHDPDPITDASSQEFVAINRRLADGCGTKYGENLALYSTEQAARDIDAIRAALGEGKLNYLGFSYGTLLGAVYAQLFPTQIRAMVLDGAVDPTQSAVASSEGQAKGFELALSNFNAWCKAHATACPISADPQGAINKAMQTARTNPLKAADGRSVTAGWVWYSVLSSLYSKDFWPYLGTGIADLNKGNPRVALLLSDLYAERDENGNYKNTADANSAVNCADGDYPTLDEIRSLQSQWRARYPFFGGPSATGLITCAVWPGKKDPYPTGPAKGAPPIVVVGTVNDPATPYASTAKLANMLGVGTVVTSQGEGHTAYPSTTCIRDAVDQYFIDLKVPAKGLDCPA